MLDTMQNDQKCNASFCSFRDELLNAVNKKIALIDKRLSAFQVDGSIIGTGEADFTKVNTKYVFNYKGKKFQLIDVPGIEGNEPLFTDYIKQALSKAHLVFFVYRGNKNPESGTLEKIRSYLKKNSSIVLILNSEGSVFNIKADKGKPLKEKHKEEIERIKKAVTQVIDEKNIAECIPVQCQCAFSAVAFIEGFNVTSIESDKEKLRNYQKKVDSYFGGRTSLKQYSNIEDVQRIIENKLLTYEDDIIRANNDKIISLIDASKEKINSLKEKYDSLMEKWEPLYEELYRELDGNFATLKQNCNSRIKSAWNAAYAEFEAVCNDDNLNDENKNQKIAEKFDEMFKNVEGKIEEIIKDEINRLEKKDRNVLRVVAEDKVKCQFYNELKFKLARNKFDVNTDVEQSSSLGILTGYLGTVVGCAEMGATIGSIFLGPGNIVGGVIGGALGVGLSAIKFFGFDKKKSVLEFKGKLLNKIKEHKNKIYDMSINKKLNIEYERIKKKREEEINQIKNDFKQIKKISYHCNNLVKNLNNCSFNLLLKEAQNGSN